MSAATVLNEVVLNEVVLNEVVLNEVLLSDAQPHILDYIVLNTTNEGLKLLTYRSVCKEWSEFIEANVAWRVQAVAHAQRLRDEARIADEALNKTMRRLVRRQRAMQRKRWGYTQGASLAALEY
jgi:hypothetical protein